MSYYFQQTVKKGFDATFLAVTEALKNEGFGMPSDINMTEIFKNKLAVDFKKYRVIGACVPQFAIKAITADDHVGLLLPCNVVVSEIDNNNTNVYTINPEHTLIIAGIKELEEAAKIVGEKLKKVLETLAS